VGRANYIPNSARALIIGQNIGTATSSAVAAIGASSTAKRLALAYIILCELIAAVSALVLCPVTIPLLVRASNTIAGVTLLAGYHTAYNVVGEERHKCLPDQALCHAGCTRMNVFELRASAGKVCPSLLRIYM
jgi:hypothetical protein